MKITVLTKTLVPPPFCEKEILRYAGQGAPDAEITSRICEMIAEIRDRLVYKVCYAVLPVKAKNGAVDFGCMELQSRDLAKNLAGCEKAILFAATIGVDIDRVIAKYSRLSPLKAVILQAIGAERIESLSDAFCREIEAETGEALRPRFSPGYGDLELGAQREIFAVLTPEKRIGLTLRDSLMMSPSKSVTAFVGFGGGKITAHACETCNKADCIYRGVK